MKSAPLPVDEEQRLRKLHDYAILDTAFEQDYDDIARLVTTVCGTDMSTISFVDQDRQWFKAAVGIEERQTSRDVAFCAHSILDDQLFVVEDALQDPRFADNPLVTEDPGIRFYAGMPLVTPDGYRLGALCAIDHQPCRLSDVQRETLRVLSRHVVDLLELRRVKRRLEQQNQRLTELSDLKSRLMSIMAHDLRSPMVSIASLMKLLHDNELSDAEEHQLFGELTQVLESTRYLIDNVIGWASRQLETAQFEITALNLAEFASEILESVRYEVERKDNSLKLDVDIDADIRADRNILVFVVRNLLVNANKFTSNGTITLRIEAQPDHVQIRVLDTGVGMNQELLEGLFDWSRRHRSEGTGGEKGAGLALLFCKDFMQRVGGDLTIESEVGKGTCATVTVPRDMQESTSD